MIAYVWGTVAEVTMENVVVDVNHIGYNVKISTKTAEDMPPIGSEVKLYTYTSVREDACWLYGFLTKDELNFFKQLITVNGVGPKVALGILSAMEVNDLRYAIMAQDSKKIAKAPGIGAKTAQRIILDLKDKVTLEDTFYHQETMDISTPKANADHIADAVEALTALGYNATEAMKAVRKVENSADMTVEELLKAALKQMAFL